MSTDSVFRLPPAFSFSFEATVMLRVPEPTDRALELLSRCEHLAEALFADLGVASGPVSRAARRDDTPYGAGGVFDFPVERHIVTVTRDGASCVLRLERMLNGHLGCKEDDFFLDLRAGTRLVRGRAYLFADDLFKLTMDGLSASEQDRVTNTIALGLRLLPLE